jgi:hypothetical protein
VAGGACRISDDSGESDACASLGLECLVVDAAAQTGLCSQPCSPLADCPSVKDVSLTCAGGVCVPSDEGTCGFGTKSGMIDDVPACVLDTSSVPALDSPCINDGCAMSPATANMICFHTDAKHLQGTCVPRVDAAGMCAGGRIPTAGFDTLHGCLLPQTNATCPGKMRMFDNATCVAMPVPAGLGYACLGDDECVGASPLPHGACEPLNEHSFCVLETGTSLTGCPSGYYSEPVIQNSCAPGSYNGTGGCATSPSSNAPIGLALLVLLGRDRRRTRR